MTDFEYIYQQMKKAHYRGWDDEELRKANQRWAEGKKKKLNTEDKKEENSNEKQQNQL